MAKGRAFQRTADGVVELGRREGAPNGERAVRDVDRWKEEWRGDPEQRERDGAADEVEDDEATAALADIANQRDELFVREMVRETEADGDIGVGQRIAQDVGPHDRDTCVRGRLQVAADDVNGEARADLLQHAAMAAADVEDAPYRLAVAAQRTKDGRSVAEQRVREEQGAMGALDDLWRKAVAIEKFGIETALHRLGDPHDRRERGRMRAIDVVGGGPAGAMAAIAALREGARVRVFEKSAFPRHKVCGEFLSPDIFALLQRAGCADEFLRLRPAVIRRMELHFGSRVVRHTLPQTTYGLSRYALDDLLLTRAAALGADLVREVWKPRAAERPVVSANGRTARAEAGNRVFGFKAHFRGTVDDSVALYFFDGCYVGVSAVEGGAINICGLAPEPLLRECAFQPDRLLARCEALPERIQGLERAFDWLNTGPLVCASGPVGSSESHIYPAGDALGFIDPFTGSGILNALLTGQSAGRAAAMGVPVDEYLAASRLALRRPFLVSTLIRRLIGTGLAGPLASLVPGSWLIHLTRPVVLA